MPNSSAAADVKSQPYVSSSLTALLLAVGLVLLRLVYMGRVDLLPEEAYYWNYAKHLDWAYLDHPPLVGWLIYLGTAVFGDGEFGIRIFALLCSLITSIFAYLTATLFYGRRAGAMAALLVQILPFFFATGFIMTPDASLTACWAGALYFLSRVIFTNSARAWLGVGVCIGLGLLSKYTIALLGPAALLFALLDPPSRVWLRRGAPYGAALLAAAIFSPVVIWNAQHDWASFAFQTTGRIATPAKFSLHQLAGALVVLLTPLGVAVAAKLLFIRNAQPPQIGATPRQNPARVQLFARVFTLTPLAVFAIFSLWHSVKLNWTGPLMLGIVPLLAAHLCGMECKPSVLLRRIWTATFALLAVGAIALLYHLAAGIPRVGYLAKMELMPVGWSEMGRSLSPMMDDLRRITPGKTLMVGMDRNFIASEAAFYQTNQTQSVRDTTGAHLFGSVSLMYEFWFPAKEQDDATLLLVSFEEKSLASRRIRKHCEKLGPITESWIIRGGVKIRPYYTRIAYHYHSIPHPLPPRGPRALP